MSDLTLGLGLGLGLGITCCCCFIGPCLFAIICGLLDEIYPHNKRVRSSSSTQHISNRRQAQQNDSINNHELILKLPTLVNSHINPLDTNPYEKASYPENFGEISRADPLYENRIHLTSHVVIQLNN
jgi:hypothetical protein